MKPLWKLAALVILSGMMGSCGIPMAAARSAGSVVRTAASAVGY